MIKDIIFCIVLAESRLAMNIFLLEITILNGERKSTLVGPIIIYYLFYFICHTIIENYLQIT